MITISRTAMHDLLLGDVVSSIKLGMYNGVEKDNSVMLNYTVHCLKYVI